MFCSIQLGERHARLVDARRLHVALVAIFEYLNRRLQGVLMQLKLQYTKQSTRSEIGR